MGITAFVVAYLFWQCGSAVMHGRRLSNAAVQNFHHQLDSEKYDEIFEMADESFRTSKSKEDSLNVLRTVHAKLGDVRSETLTQVTVQSTGAGTFVTATYRTTFDQGEAIEQFTWVKRGETLLLRGYHVDSNALIS